jgi:uncharacterized protein YecE (DUF72 family)
MAPGKVRVGTSSFSAAGWKGTFYPAGLKASDYLGFYAQHFDTVEIDSTWYGAPAERTVKSWAAQTPDNFLISAKIPQVITHERCLENCEAEFFAFISVMEHLGPKLGILLFQFPYFKQESFASAKPFVKRLDSFLKKLPGGIRFAVEIRNKAWLTPEFLELLRAHGVTCVFLDHPWMPTSSGYLQVPDATTADFGYVRLLGDRYAIEEKTTSWDKTIIDRSHEFRDWTTACEKLTRRGVDTFVYINNHYAGHAPASVREFLQYWKERDKTGTPELGSAENTKTNDSQVADQKPPRRRKTVQLSLLEPEE